MPGVEREWKRVSPSLCRLGDAIQHVSGTNSCNLEDRVRAHGDKGILSLCAIRRSIMSAAVPEEKEIQRDNIRKRRRKFKSDAGHAPMSCTSTSTSTSSKLAGKLTLSGGSMHPSQSTAHSRPTFVVADRQKRASGPPYGRFLPYARHSASPQAQPVIAVQTLSQASPQQDPLAPSLRPTSVQFHQRCFNLILVPATPDIADIISIESR